jgi:hypothetical protein
MTLEQLAEGIKTHATDEEKKLLLPLFRKKLQNKLKDLSVEDRKAYGDLLNEIILKHAT